MSSRSATSRLTVLRQSRALPPGPTPLTDTIRRAAAEIRTLATRAASAEGAWAAVAPPAIAALVSQVERAAGPKAGKGGGGGVGGRGGGGGVLRLKPRGAAARFALDRWLRAGGEAALRAADPRITAVRIVR